MTSTPPSTKRLERSTPSETAIRWPTTELLLSSLHRFCQGSRQLTPGRRGLGYGEGLREMVCCRTTKMRHSSSLSGGRWLEIIQTLDKRCAPLFAPRFDLRGDSHWR